MLSIFGYLVFAIFYKWTVDWPASGQPAPSLIGMLIAFFMSPGKCARESLYAHGRGRERRDGDREGKARGG
eukprot:6173403-Pleurochrysis_carterae.AAC.1